MDPNNDEPGAPPATPDAWSATVRVDLRDVILLAGVVCALAGAAAFHWGLALLVGGFGLAIVALWLGRK